MLYLNYGVEDNEVSFNDYENGRICSISFDLLTNFLSEEKTEITFHPRELNFDWVPIGGGWYEKALKISIMDNFVHFEIGTYDSLLIKEDFFFLMQWYHCIKTHSFKDSEGNRVVFSPHTLHYDYSSITEGVKEGYKNSCDWEIVADGKILESSQCYCKYHYSIKWSDEHSIECIARAYSLGTSWRDGIAKIIKEMSGFDYNWYYESFLNSEA